MVSGANWRNSTQRMLGEHPVEASAPCRIDSGGTWDIKAMALPLAGIEPATVNMALDLRTSVVLTPCDPGWVKISSEGFPGGEAFPVDRLPFLPPFGLFFAAVSHFGFHGIEVHIRSKAPVKSALGGSSTALVALIKALSKAQAMLGERDLSPREILHLAYHLEDGISGGNCGLQDHAAAVYGGINLWKWRHGHPTSLFEKKALLDRKGQRELSRCLLVAYSGKSHVSANINRRWIQDFLSTRTRAGWIKVNDIVGQFAQAIEDLDWRKAARLLQEEMAVRKEITPQAFIPITAKLVSHAEACGCGARFAGAGAGGSLWALGEEKDIRKLKEIWKSVLSAVKNARVLDCRVDPMGVK